MILYAILTVIAAYLIGSISFAVLFSKLFIKTDVRELGSGNAGTTNVMRVGGFLPGFLTFVCDALKGFLGCYIGKTVFSKIFENSAEWAVYGAFICGIACMLGHVFPIFFQFRGGKGIAISVGIFAVCCPKAIIIGLAVFALCVLITKIVSLSSIIATVTVITLTMIFQNPDAKFWPQAVISVLMGLIIILKHSGNIKRLISGTEKKMTFGGEK